MVDSKALSTEAIARLPHSVLHADLNDTNLLFEGDKVVGVLDFGDSIYSCTVKFRDSSSCTLDRLASCPSRGAAHSAK